MEIDNFHHFESMPLAEGEFLFLQIIQRKKDVADLGRQRRIISHFCADNQVSLSSYKSHLVDICRRMNARAYIYFGPRVYRDVHVGMLQELATRLTGAHSDRGIKNLFASVCGKTCAKGKQTFLVDIDVKDETFLQEVRDFVNNDCVPIGDKIVDVMETRSGWHLITRPFDVKYFQARYPDIDLHRNAATLLYAP